MLDIVETWRAVVGYEGLYEVSDLGRVRGLDRIVKDGRSRTKSIAGRILKPQPMASGHLDVQLRCDGRRRHFRVHQLVACAFVVGEAPGLEICHRNGDPSDNNAANLRWGTHGSNVQDAVDHGTHFQARKTHCKRGHEFTAENTYRPPGRPRRICMTCQRENHRKAVA